MLFEIEISKRQPRFLYFKQHFDTEEVILQQPREQVLYFYSTTATKKNEVGQSVTSYLNKTAKKAVPRCTLVLFGMQTIGFLFEKEYVLFF